MEKVKITVWTTDDWHRKIKSEAALRGITISELINKAVNEWLENNPKE